MQTNLLYKYIKKNHTVQKLQQWLLPTLKIYHILKEKSNNNVTMKIIENIKKGMMHIKMKTIIKLENMLLL